MTWQALLDMWAMKNEASVTHIEETTVSQLASIWNMMAAAPVTGDRREPKRALERGGRKSS